MKSFFLPGVIQFPLTMSSCLTRDNRILQLIVTKASQKYFRYSFYLVSFSSNTFLQILINDYLLELSDVQTGDHAFAEIYRKL
jgi:hypothetical protein